MGGFGSGRRAKFGKAVTECSLSLDIRWLQRTDSLRPGDFYSLRFPGTNKPTRRITVQVDSSELILSYQQQDANGQCLDLEYPVGLVWTPCYYGGRRTWFICPESACGRRVAKLYLGDNGSFACRHCAGLAYASQREAPDRRAKLRAGNIRKRLGWPQGILNQCTSKPRGMHWKTYWRLRAEHDALVEVALDGMDKRLGTVEGRLRGLMK